MTKEAFAAILNGREYTKEINEQEEAIAKANNFLVVFGASDDLCELRGAINDETGPESIFILDGALLPPFEDGDEDVLKRHGFLEEFYRRNETALVIDPLWDEEPGYSWTYRTDAPHATFDIMDDGEKYCRGIVIDLKETK